MKLFSKQSSVIAIVFQTHLSHSKIFQAYYSLLFLARIVSRLIREEVEANVRISTGISPGLARKKRTKEEGLFT